MAKFWIMYHIQCFNHLLNYGYFLQIVHVRIFLGNADA